MRKKEEKIKPHVTVILIIDEYPQWQTPVKLEEEHDDLTLSIPK